MIFRIALFQGVLLLTAAAAAAQQSMVSDEQARQADERLSFQIGHPWSPRTNVNADVAMVYGIGPHLDADLQTWTRRGYIPAVMTGVAWGSYQDYLNGAFDGERHWDQAQTGADGLPILHGGSRDIPYISPGDTYGRYLARGVRRAIDAGARSIYLEEPEFWAASGWEENFKREWKAFYHEDWVAPNSSPDAQYRASKLKYILYRRALKQVFDDVKEYGQQKGLVIPCYVATHSLLSYANWRIVSPESSLLDVGAEGYIAQVWTGTARTPNYLDGVRRERTFESAFLEYGSMQNLARASGKRIYFLNDPIEDDPNHDWDDYRTNWENTLTASLLQPDVWRYEIMPWPDRVFNSVHPLKTEVTNGKTVEELEARPAGTGLGGFGPAASGKMIGIPAAYETELQSVISALGDMKQSDTAWIEAGTQGVGVLVSDTMMFERADPSPSDAAFGSFNGLALPLVTRGVPVEPVQMETAGGQGFLSSFKILLLTYEGQKPPAPEIHSLLADWVRQGGALVVVDKDADPYNSVREWWNTAPNAYRTPREDLFARLGIPVDGEGVFTVGKGVVVSRRVSPAALTYRKDGAALLRGYVREAAAASHLAWKESNAMVLRRGPYVIAAGLADSSPQAKPYLLHGSFVNLFDARLPVMRDPVLAPESRYLLVDLDRASQGAAPRVIAAGCRVRNEQSTGNQLRFEADGVAKTQAAVRILTQRKPRTVTVGGSATGNVEYDPASGTALIRFENAVDPIAIAIDFAH